MCVKGLVTEEVRRVELGIALLLAETGDTELLVDHLRVCRDIMQIQLDNMVRVAHNLSAADAESVTGMGETLKKALEALNDADAA